MAVEAARDALTGARPGHDRGAALRLHHLSVPGPAAFWHRRRRPEPVRGHLGHRRRRHPAGRHLGADRGDSSQRRETLVVASEKRGARAASPVEMTSGDGAAAILVGEGKPIATLLAKASRTTDFVDHFRSLDNQFDYQWEERWIRDAGYMTVVPPVIKRCLEAARSRPRTSRTSACRRRWRAWPAPSPRPPASTTRRVRSPARQLRRHRRRPHPAPARRRAREGQGRRQDPPRRLRPGCRRPAVRGDARDRQAPKNLGVAGHLARRKEEPSYGRFLAFNDLIELERGMRSETDKATALSSLWRNRETVTSFIGGKCSKMRHAADAEERHLRQSQLQRH